MKTKTCIMAYIMQTVLGRAMSSITFSFKHRTVNGMSEYWLSEK